MNSRHLLRRSFLFVSVVSLLGFFLGGCAHTQLKQAPVIEQPPLRLACVGDSITAGYQMPDPEHNAYPAQLARLLGAGWEVRNFGVSGACVMEQGGYPYNQRPAHGEALAWKPDVVVIALGTNDAKVENIASHPENFTPSYHALIARFRAANPKVRIFVCQPVPAFPEAMGIAERVIAAEIRPRIQEVASGEKLPLVDLYEALKDQGAHFPDKIHPDPEGGSLIAQAVYGDLMLNLQEPAKSLQASVNTAVLPVSRLEQDSYNWWGRHAAQLALHGKVDPQVVLIGDSITHFWAGKPAGNHVNGAKAWAETFGARQVVNLGFGWDRTQNVLWRLEHGEFDGYRPKLVILNIGTNNLTGTVNARTNTPEEIAEAVQLICERLQQKAPGTKVLVMGVLPRGHRASDGLRAPIAELNRLLSVKLAGQRGVQFLDIGQRFLDAQGNMAPSLMPDGTHPSEEGYHLWGQALVASGLLP